MPQSFAILGIALMFVAWLLIPLGVPGLWVMLAFLGVGVLYGDIGLLTLVLLVGVGAVAELLEFLLVRRYSARYGGSGAAFWAAIAGGLVGVLVGLPVPVVGSILAGLVGSFAGAAVVTLWESRDALIAARVGWGVVIARMLAAAVKSAAGIVILVVGSASLLMR